MATRICKSSLDHNGLPSDPFAEPDGTPDCRLCRSIRRYLFQKRKMTKSMQDLQTKINVITREIDDLWKGMDYISNPLK